MRFLGIATVAAFFALTAGLHAEEGDGPDASVITNVRQAALSVPNNVGTDGAFSYSVPIKIPAFRGLEPNLALQYNSQNRSRGGAEDTIGRGWTLGGLSTIERVSVGSGAPSYQNGQDVFLLDGVELLGCKGSGATNPLTLDYPAQYMTNTPSASCKAGGNFVALRDQGLKILRTGSDINRNTKFFVYRSDGTRLKYESLGQISGAAKTGSPELMETAWRRKWVLTEIRDAQATSNVVQIKYHAGTSQSAYTARVKSIEYAGYQVIFKYLYKGDTHPVVKFATGTSNFGWQNFLLKSIVVKNWGSKIRAYRLAHDTSALTKAHILTAVTEIGNDYVSDGPRVDGGSKMPRWTFEYTGDNHSFVWKPVNANFHTSMTVIDRNRDGRDELIFFKFTKSSSSTQDPSYTLPKRRLKFSTDRTLQYSGSHTLPDFYSSVSRDESRSRFFAGWSRRDQSTGKYAIFSTGASSETSTTTAPGAPKDVIFPINATFSLPKLYLIGNFFGDPETEVIWWSSLYDLDDGKLVHAPGHSHRLFRDIAVPLEISGETWAADIDGDGYDEIIQEERVWDHRQGGFVSYAIDRGAFSHFRRRRGEFLFGDVNGDGKADLVTHNRNNTDEIGVSLSNGNGFQPVDWSWGNHLGIDFNSTRYRGARSTVADINGDGLADLVVHKGHRRSNYDPDGPQTIGLGSGSSFPGAPKGSMIPDHAQVFLSDGSKFVKTPQGKWFETFYGLGDFDGDGRLDVVFRDTRKPNRQSTIAFNSSGLHVTLKRVTEPDGEVIDVSYKPSSHFGVSEIPGVRQLVSKIVRRNGVAGKTRTTQYEYAGGKFQHNLRKSLGYATITAILPKIPGEDVNPRLVTEYATNNWGVKGNITRQRLYYGDAIQRETKNFWSLVGGKRPYRSYKTQEVQSVRWGDRLIPYKTQYDYTDWGAPHTIRHLGISQTGAVADNHVTRFQYGQNLSKYILNKPIVKVVADGTAATFDDASNWLQAEFFTYDNGAAPNNLTRGNLTKVEAWSGAGVSARRIQAELAYDDWGNVVRERDAKGNETTHAYDTSKHLFRTASTNAKSQTVQTSWHAGCQAPLTTTDLNGLVTKITYDAHCREVRRDFPNRLWVTKAYFNLGNPDRQLVRTRTSSGSTRADSNLKEIREYFNGFGEVYKTTHSGVTEVQADYTVTERTFDARGNLLSESVPHSWGAAAGSFKFTTFRYDPLNRLIRKTNPDGTYSKVGYTNETFTDYRGQSAAWPTTVSQNAHCFDDDPATLCGKVRNSVDAAGNLIRMAQEDTQSTDIGSGASGDRFTHYTYDNIGRLTQVVDPIGATWSYTYDSFGNRIQANDPGLGLWTMEYDANNNLTRQVDAKAQEITFAYDTLNRVTLKTVGTGLDRYETQFTYDEPRTGAFNNGQLTTQKVWHPTKGDIHTITRDYGKDGQMFYQTDTVDGRTFEQSFTYRHNGALDTQTLPNSPGTQSTITLPAYEYDAAGRMTSFGPYITNVSYDTWSNPTSVAYGNGVQTVYQYNPHRGWVNRIEVAQSPTNVIDFTEYTRTATGRVAAQDTKRPEGDMAYTYDYSGRLLTAVNQSGVADYDQSFSYDVAGSMRSNSRVGEYSYAPGRHAPDLILTPAGSTSLTYDANGNMTQGLGGKSMTYDNENRPLSVVHNGTDTRYVYGADGTRLKKIEGVVGSENTTLYLGAVEIRNFGQGTAEEFLLYPHADVRLSYKNVGGTETETVSYMHRDQLQSVKAITGADGAADMDTAYRPFGEQQEWVLDTSFSEETKGFIGERYDDDSGLQYLNARYYDPELGIFIQPDWFEVTKPGVGTNRYAYSFNDPVNLADPNGNFVPLAVWGAIAAYKAISVAITVVDTVQTVQSLADGSTTVGEAVKQAATDAVIGATVGKGVAEVAGKAVDVAKGAVKRFVKEETGSVPGPSRLPDDAVVCRGGSCTAERFSGGSGVGTNADGTLNGVSVNSAPGSTLDELTEGIPHSKVGVTTVGDVRTAGGDVVASPTKGNPNHATMSGITPDKAEELMTPTVKNPNARKPNEN